MVRERSSDRYSLTPVSSTCRAVSLSATELPAFPLVIDPVFVGSDHGSFAARIRRSRPVSLAATEFRLCFVLCAKPLEEDERSWQKVDC